MSLRGLRSSDLQRSNSSQSTEFGKALETQRIAQGVREEFTKIRAREVSRAKAKTCQKPRTG
jgi:hypothetical protein